MSLKTSLFNFVRNLQFYSNVSSNDGTTNMTSLKRLLLSKLTSQIVSELYPKDMKRKTSISSTKRVKLISVIINKFSLVKKRQSSRKYRGFSQSEDVGTNWKFRNIQHSELNKFCSFLFQPREIFIDAYYKRSMVIKGSTDEGTANITQ